MDQKGLALSISVAEHVFTRWLLVAARKTSVAAGRKMSRRLSGWGKQRSALPNIFWRARQTFVRCVTDSKRRSSKV
jgi:hypothetical protein